MQIKYFQPFTFGMIVHCSLKKICENKGHVQVQNFTFDYL